jgi:hypothetical protein
MATTSRIKFMGVGVLGTGFAFFPLIVQNFPADPSQPIPLQAQTADPVTINGDVAIEWSYDPLAVFDVFLEKRSHIAAEAVVYNAIREGYRTAMAGWSVECDGQSRVSVCICRIR